MSAPLHIIQTVGSIAERSGGPARTIRDLTEALARAGARVSLVAGHDPVHDDALLPPDPALVELTLVPVDRRWRLPRYDFTSAIAPLAARPATILHDNGIWSPAHIGAVAAARRLALPLVISPHGMLDPWAMAYKPGKKHLAWQLYQRRLLAAARGLVATAGLELGPIRARLPKTPIALIANGVLCPPIPPDRSARDRDGPRTVLFLSRIHPKKNLPGLLIAWKSLVLRPEFDCWTLRIAGPDELGHRAELVAQATALGLETRVSIEGAIPESAKAEAFATADVFILPTFSENFGIVVAEALAHGVPAIATTGAPWESLAGEQCGWHVAPAPAALAAALAEAMTLTPAARRAMGQRGHAHVARDFGWDAIARQTLAFYDWLLGRGARPGFVDG